MPALVTEHWRQAHSAGVAARWAREGQREAQAERTRLRWATDPSLREAQRRGAQKLRVNPPPEDRAEIARIYATAGLRETARRCGYSDEVVRRVLAEDNVPIRRPGAHAR